jgi:hypothetical protein
MASKKINDVAVRVGEYQDAQGATKGRYLNIGSTFQSDDGGVFMILDAHIFHASLYALTQAAAKARDAAAGRRRTSYDGVMVSLFEADRSPTGAPSAGLPSADDVPF